MKCQKSFKIDRKTIYKAIKTIKKVCDTQKCFKIALETMRRLEISRKWSGWQWDIPKCFKLLKDKRKSLKIAMKRFEWQSDGLKCFKSPRKPNRFEQIWWKIFFYSERKSKFNLERLRSLAGISFFLIFLKFQVCGTDNLKLFLFIAKLSKKFCGRTCWED